MNESITNEFVLDNWFQVDVVSGKHNYREVLFVESPSADVSMGCWLTFDYNNGMLEGMGDLAKAFPVKRILVESWEQVNE